MSSCEDSNINKSYVIQTVGDVDIFSACTEIYLTNIVPCTGDTININSNLNVSGNISGTTYYGDGSQLSGIITTDNYVTGGVYSASTKSLYFTGTTGFTPFTIDVSQIVDSTNNYVTGGTYNPVTDTISLVRNDNVTVDITGVTDTFTTGGTYDNGTALITFVKNDNTSYTVDLSGIDVNDTFVTGSTLNGDVLTITRNDGFNIVVTGFSQTFTGNTSGTCIGDIYVSNIHSCSPLRINSNDEGNVYFGSTSGITIDVLNQRVGIGTNSPTEALVVSGNTIVGGTLTIGNIPNGKPVNNLGFDSGGTVVVGTTGDTDTNTFVTGGTLSGNDLILEKNNNVDVNPIDLSGLVSGKTDLTLFNSHTGDTSNPHQTSFGNLTSTAHTHTLSEITDFNDYSGDVQTQIDSKVETTVFNSHTGDTNNPHQTSFSNLTATAHTHSISDVINLQTELDSKTDNTDFVSHTGDTTIHFTKGDISLSEIGNSAHTHTLSEITDFNTYSGSVQTQIDSKLNISDFNTYSGNVQTQLDSKVENGINSGGANEVFSGKSGTDLYFRTISGGSNTTISTIDDIIRVDVTVPIDTNTFVTGGTYNSGTLTLDRNDGNSVVVTGFTTGGDNFYVTGFTYNDANTFTISQNGGLGDLTSTINTMTGLTVNGTLVVDTISATTINGSVTGLTLNDLDDVTTNIPTTPDNTYQGELLYFDVTSNQWVSGAEYGNLGEVTIWGKKGSAGTIDKGLPVYITGFDDDIHEVELANATTATTMPVIGFTAEEFDNAGVYPLVTFGKITGLDTTSGTTTLNPNGETWEVNDVLYMSTTTGGLTKFRPTGTNTQIQRIAKVLKVSSNSGQLFIFNTARTAGLPNLTTDYLWLGNGDDTPQEVIRTDVGITTTGFTYNNNNTFTITDDNGGSFSSTINQMSGLTINGDLDVTGDTTLNTLTATSITSNSAINVFNGHINLRDNSYFLQGRTNADVNVSLIGVDNQDRVFVGNAGYDTFIDSDTIVDGSLTATTLNITTIGSGTPVGNLGFDSNGQVVTGTTGVSDANKIFSWFMNVT